MKLFIDSADVSEIQKAYETGLIEGVTTNPSLILKSGRKPESVYEELKSMGVKDISMEVVGDLDYFVSEGKRLRDTFGNVCTKLPMTVDGLKACRILSRDLIRVNVTLIFSAAQAILAAKAGAHYVSPFVGRCDDKLKAGLEVVRSIAEVYGRQRVTTQVLSASLRDVYKVTRSFYNGATW